jgi:uncharacterized membrane-anchored protein YhcB (DUF1043 family)
VNGSVEELFVPVLIGAIVGLFIGYIAGRRGAPGAEHARDLERQLSSLRDERAQFEQRVNAHFADTAGKLNTLTENYREVYAQIASGAAALCSTDKGPRFDALAAPAADDGDAKANDAIEADSVQLQPPRDYAPKASPESPGVLDEDYGVDKDDVPPDHSKDDDGEEEEKEKAKD